MLLAKVTQLNSKLESREYESASLVEQSHMEKSESTGRRNWVYQYSTEVTAQEDKSRCGSGAESVAALDHSHVESLGLWDECCSGDMEHLFRARC
jgi:hypothetical protein